MTKLYAGATLREIRSKFALTQREFAQKLGISLPYLNQMENNNRPVSTTVLLNLAREFGYDVSLLSQGEADRLIADLDEAMRDPVFQEAPALSDLRLVAANAPGFARAFLAIHSAYAQAQDRLAALDEMIGSDSQAGPPSAWEEVRDFFHYQNNYIDTVDRAAEKFSHAIALTTTGETALLNWLQETHQITVERCRSTNFDRHFDPAQGVIRFHAGLPVSTRVFQLLNQIALLDQPDLIETTLAAAKFQSLDAQEIARIGLANYFAGAALMPYTEFLARAEALKHDLQELSHEFGASIEQVAHRLSTLQRPGHKGIPFFFVRVDQAGTITKRHSATALQFARYGNACPLWNVHRAFEAPGQFLRQLAETPDGKRYFCLATDVSKPGTQFKAPQKRYAIGLGCELHHAEALVYTEDLDLKITRAFEPIGISCRICPRAHCHQRAVPPIKGALKINPNKRSILPYEIG